jgi:membrane associated rhomboid family serine protease
MNSILWFLLNEIFNLSFSIGFSGVLFGLITIFPHTYFFGFNIKRELFPFYMLGFMQLIIPNASFAGHLIGIFSGMIYDYYF